VDTALYAAIVKAEQVEGAAVMGISLSFYGESLRQRRNRPIQLGSMARINNARETPYRASDAPEGVGEPH